MDVSALSQLAGAMQSNTLKTAQQNDAIDGTSIFKDVYDKLIDQVNTTDSAYQGDMIKAAEGELDNPQQLTIDSSKAAIALQMVTSVRNNALEAYNDVLKMSV